MNKSILNKSIFAALPLAVAVLAAPAHAQTFSTYLNGAQSPTSSPATGFGTVRLDAGGPTGQRLFVSENISGLTAPLTEFHIHAPAAPGFNGPVLYNFASPDLGDPLHLLGKTSFSFTDFEIDLPAVLTASNGSLFTQAQQVTFLQAGVDYINVHTSAFPNGEIRGQIPSASPAAVPETGTAISFGLLLACGSLALIVRRKAVRA